ncbi:hypothetical protein CAP36_00950 [Chitinophagaceae bacterium IBVUCB2]|nr:hypothetical protein CAP36_00950 [Chitinophagaceae bacterium IBVUCB2]
MKQTSTLFLITATVIMGITTNFTATAQQQYKLRQVNSMMGMKSETTIYVKGMRKRTEGGNMSGMGAKLTTIEQCDKQRTITINDKKKLYYIEPFSKDAEEIIDDDAKPAVKTKATPVVQKAGGVIHMYYNITDTGERKKMYGFTARHIWTTQKIKPSPDACMMKDSMIIKTDGWYIDLPEFNCPIRYTPSNNNGGYQQPDCKDRYVSHRSGKGKLGFPLIEKRTMIMGNGAAQTSEFVTDLETLELITGKLDSMLFEIPPGYTLAKSADELQDKYDVAEIMKQAGNSNYGKNDPVPTVTEEKKSNVIRIGVYEPKTDGQLTSSSLQQYIAGNLSSGNIEAVSITSEEEAKKYQCDLILNTEFVKVKSGSKVGGLLKAIKNTDPNAASSYTIEANLFLTNLADGSTRLQQSVSGKYDGKPDDAAKKAMDEGCRLLLKGLK